MVDGITEELARVGRDPNSVFIYAALNVTNSNALKAVSYVSGPPSAM